MIEIKNIFSEIPTDLSQEIFHDIIKNNNFKLEKIISTGQSTPAGQWLEEAQNEWVILLKGSAELLFENNMQKIKLKPGDYLFIPSYTKHRVETTDKEKETIWLALHY
ncbi:MAG: cupin domain-containing protein [FCB group bacterium]|jgi:cupin 2 domain-containing protein